MAFKNALTIEPSAMVKRVLVLYGLRGCGKTYLKDSLIKNYNEVYYEARQVTTRPKRDTEIGTEYDWVTEEEYDTLNLNNELIARTTVNGYRYGTRVSSFREVEELGRRPSGIIVVDNEGLNDLKTYAEVQGIQYRVFGIFNVTPDVKERNQDIKKLWDNIEGFNNCDYIFNALDPINTQKGIIYPDCERVFEWDQFGVDYE